ncbi:uncharacterized protein M8220_013160 [Acridotheres tristis]
MGGRAPAQLLLNGAAVEKLLPAVAGAAAWPGAGPGAGGLAGLHKAPIIQGHSPAASRPAALASTAPATPTAEEAASGRREHGGKTMDEPLALRRGLRLLRDGLEELFCLSLFLCCGLLLALVWRPRDVLPWLLLVALLGPQLGALLWLLLSALLWRPLAALLWLPLAALLWLLLGARAGLGLLRGTESPSELLGLSALAKCCRQVLRISTLLLIDLVKACLAGARSLFTLLAALWDSLAGCVRSVRERLAPFLARVAGRATAVAIRLWPHCQLTFKLLCSATVVFISVYFLVYNLIVVRHSGAQSLHTVSVTLWDSLTSLVSRVTDLLAAFLALVSSGAITVSMLLWWPCHMAFELLGFITKVFTSISFLLKSLLKSLLSLCLMGRQYLSMLLDIHWDLLSSLILGVTTVLEYLSSALYIPLWLPYQLALMLLPFATQVFTSIFFVGVYILKSLLYIAFPIAIYSAIYYNREVLWVLKRRVLNSFRRRQRDVRRLYQGAVLTLTRARNSRPWRRLVDWVLRVTSGSQAGRMMNQGRDQLDASQVPQPPAGAGQRPQTPREESDTSQWKASRKQQLNATAGNAEGTPNNDLWVLLKEQEERKKCVICQDQTKTVLLLPCRHLCLCQECTEVLLQKDQHNCPLCRQEIEQTLTVYL